MTLVWRRVAASEKTEKALKFSIAESLFWQQINIIFTSICILITVHTLATLMSFFVLLFLIVLYCSSVVSDSVVNLNPVFFFCSNAYMYLFVQHYQR